MNKLFQTITTVLFLALLVQPVIPHANAAEFRAGEQVRVPATEQNLNNLYMFGEKLQLDAPVSNELTIAGGDITINSPIAGSALVAGGNITLNGSIGNNARIAGGDITIDGPITNDLVIAGGEITITKNASIGGDLIFAGGKLTVDGPVAGKIQAQGGEITINNTVGGDVSGDIGQLALGPQAMIMGDLSYKSREKAQVAQGATIAGQTKYQQDTKEREGAEDAAAFFTGASIYKLVVDILICLLFVYFLKRGIMTSINRMRTNPIKSGVLGFAFMVLTPIATLFMFILIWLGVASALFSFLIMIIGLFIAKLFLGWAIIHWVQKRNHHQYHLDWKAGVIGPIIVFVLMFIPVFGWLTIAVIFCIALGAMLQELTMLVATQKSLTSPKKN